MLTRARGFTLIELMITIAIIGLTMALTVPAIRNWTANSQIRSAGSALQSALRLAQAEAVRNSQDVMLYRTNDTGCTGKPAAASGGARWVIRSLALGNRAAETLQCGAVTEGFTTLTVTGPTVVCFGPHGRPQVMNSSETNLGVGCTSGSNGRIIYDVTSTTVTTNLKKLQVWLSLGGSVRLCDKERAVSDTVPDGCPVINQAATT